MSNTNRAVYATQPQPLQQQVDTLLRAARPEPIDGDILAVIAPDTNLLQGGPVSAEVYKLLEGRTYDTVVLVEPSHTGAFARMNICSVDRYHTPLGTLPVNDRVRTELCDEDDDIYLDDRGHFHNEGVDVQLPYLQRVLRDFDIVPIVMGEETPEFSRELGQALGEVMYNRRTLIVACADLLEGAPEALDQLRTNLETFDVSRLMTLFNSETVRVEGKGAVLVAVIAALARRANHARVLRLEAPSGDHPGFLGAVLWRS